MSDKIKVNTRFDGRAARSVTHTSYPILFIENYTKSLAPLVITKLGHHPIIFGRS